MCVYCVENVSTTLTYIALNALEILMLSVKSVNKYCICKVLSVPFACVGSSDPARALHLYTMNTLDTL